MVAVAARQHNVIGRAQMMGLGLGYDAIRARCESGWLNELFQGAYAVGRGNLTRRSYWKAASISTGNSPLFGRSAAQLWRFADLIPGPPHVVVSHGRSVKRPGILIHRTRSLSPADVTVHHRIPVTTPARTLLDFAAQAAPGELRDAVWAADRRRLLDAAEVARLCDGSRGRKGTDRLRALLDEERGPVAETRSPLEDLFLPICADFGIRMPLVNVPVLGFEVDCLWLPERLIVELDGWEFHQTRESFESDRRRDAKLGVAGYQVLRATNERMTAQRSEVAADVSALLATRAATA